MIVHFAIRSAKNYLNIVRFAKLEREALKCNLKINSGSPKNFLDAVEKYHISWRSPLAVSTIVKKVIFEFGFLYIFGFVCFMYWVVARALPDEKIWNSWIVFLAVALSSSIEIGMFSHSPYIRDPAPDHDSQSKA